MSPYKTLDFFSRPSRHTFHSCLIYAPAAALPLASVGAVIGTVVGSHVLRRIPEVWFRRVLAVVLAALGVVMF